VGQALADLYIYLVCGTPSIQIIKKERSSNFQIIRRFSTLLWGVGSKSIMMPCDWAVNAFKDDGESKGYIHISQQLRATTTTLAAVGPTTTTTTASTNTYHHFFLTDWWNMFWWNTLFCLVFSSDGTMHSPIPPSPPSRCQLLVVLLSPALAYRTWHVD